MAPLEDLLDDVAKALLVGDFGTLATLTPQIEGMTEGLSTVSPEAANRLQRKAERNARLLEAATRGVKAARRRVLEITQGPTLTTYDARGLKAAIAPQGLVAARRV